MPLVFVNNDITRMSVDAIVNAANNSLLGGGGVDGAIHRAAGPGLLEECRRLDGCKTGQSKMTGAYALPCRHIIHTVGPVWRGGTEGEADFLASCYRSALELAGGEGFDSVAFPLISAGVFGYPAAEALRIAVGEIASFLGTNDMLVYLAVLSRNAIDPGEKLLKEVTGYLDAVFEEEPSAAASGPQSSAYMPYEVQRVQTKGDGLFRRPHREDDARNETVLYGSDSNRKNGGKLNGQEKSRGYMRSGFGRMLTAKAWEKTMDDQAVCRFANIGRNLVNRIKNDPDYLPDKRTVTAFAIALKLSVEDTAALLEMAGHTFSHGDRMDIVVEYFIGREIYDIHLINEVLFRLGLQLLGG